MSFDQWDWRLLWSGVAISVIVILIGMMAGADHQTATFDRLVR
jgi:hypothetical protein